MEDIPPCLVPIHVDPGSAPDALKPFLTIMLTSTAIPGAFTPSMSDGVVDGEPYQEMHVDGGPTGRLWPRGGINPLNSLEIAPGSVAYNPYVMGRMEHNALTNYGGGLATS